MFFLNRKLRSGPDTIDAGPLDHPDIRRMSPRELADLPWPRADAIGADQPPVASPEAVGTAGRSLPGQHTQPATRSSFGASVSL